MDAPLPIPSPAETPEIHTYHCLCTTLLLATPHPLSSLPHRAPPALDAALILPLPPPPTSTSRSPSPVSDDEEEVASRDEDRRKIDEEGINAMAVDGKGLGRAGPLYSMVLSTTIDRKALIVRRADGWEKRWVWRCGRCRVGVGYSLEDGARAGTGGESMEGTERQKQKVVYLLPGGLVGTREMMAGGFGGDGEVAFGEGK